MEYRQVRTTVLAVLLLCGFAPAWGAETFPWIEATPDDLALQTVAAHPDAPAVFMNRKTLLVMGFTGFKGNQTHVDEYRRLKILNTEGLEVATISLPSIDWAKIKKLDARITQPDGSIRELSKDDVFSKTQSKSDRYKIISFALPQAEVGSIIEYRFTIVYENRIIPWQLYFQGWLPVLESTIAVDTHEYTEYNIKAINSLGEEPEQVTEDSHSQYRNLKTQRSTFTVRDLPLVPEEPFSPPFEEIAARVELMPLRIRTREGWIRYAKNLSWPGLAAQYSEGMEKYREWAPKTEAFVEQKTSGLTTQRAKAAALYEFVRNSIEQGPSPCKKGLCPPDNILKARVGDSYDRILFLQHLLHLAGLQSAVVWMSQRTEAKMNRSFPDYSDVNHFLVMVTLDGEQVFLDPRNKSKQFGLLEPQLEGEQCILVRGDSSAWSKTPMQPAEYSTRRVQLDLQIDEAGQVSGEGRMVLTGHHSWLRSNWDQDEYPVIDRWKRWMEPGAGTFSSWIATQFPEFKVDVTELAWSDEERGLVGSWEMKPAGSAETDFISLPAAAPLGLQSNPFAISPDKRVTPARLLFPFVDDLELHITWPEGWSLDSVPEPGGTESYIGKVALEATEGVGELRFHRTFSLERMEIDGSYPYEKLHELYATTLQADLEPIILVKDE